MMFFATLFCGNLLGAGLAAAETQSFGAWLEGLRQEALSRGIAPTTLQAALADVQPIPRVIELDRSQPEFTLTFDQYLERVVPESRVKLGQRMLAEHRALLEEIGAKYGVQPRFIVALWGVETDFGRLTGGFDVVSALATLAHDGRRSDFFRKELLDALQILDEGHISPAAMEGSWAGAMGQSQFMPSSFRQFAVDYNKDGRRDIWGTKADVFASIANYLSSYNWHPDRIWGRPVRLPANFDPDLVGVDIEKPLREWQRLGVRKADGGNLPTAHFPGSIVMPGGSDGPAFMVYSNYKVILRWNRSTYFATAVGHLADRIGEMQPAP
ncbi:lytic murein transglycosylase [Rhodospirillaceae bacterium SYSU D60014]|uniref:lytic murein transglycosylase n=1 Tax=Virgifigura deserti TaxID=2268457 RepID=UPI000E65F421